MGEKSGNSEQDIRDVFEFWQARQSRPAVCRLSDSRRKLLRARLREYSADELITLVRYAYESSTPEARWWRGDNPSRKKYTDLANLLRVSKLDRRVETATEWAAEQDAAVEESGGLFRRTVAQ